MNPVASPPAVTAPPRKRRWLRRVLVILFVFVGLPAGYYFYATWSLNKEIARAISETDGLDPRWRLEDIQADCQAAADQLDSNSAWHITRIIKSLSKTAVPSPRCHKDYDAIFPQLEPAIQLNLQQLELIREVLDKIPEALVEARKLKDMPNGYFPLQRPFDGAMLFLNLEVSDHSLLYDLLQNDAMLQAQQGNPDAALDSCMALLNAARSLASDPLMAAVHIHAQGMPILVDAVERTLALGHSGDASLSELQNRLRRQQRDLREHWVLAVRGERAMYHRFLESIREGRTRLGEYMAIAKSNGWNMTVTFQDRLANYLPALVTRHYPDHLRHRNELVAAARLPLEQQVDRFKALASKVDRNDQRRGQLEELVPLFPPNLAEECIIFLRGQALLASAETGLACERFRVTHERWPTSLADLVEAKLVVAVPMDPFDGQPLRMIRRVDGITVYSVGMDKENNSGRVDAGFLEPGTDIGFRLWDPEHRRQPPRPPVTIER